MYDEIYNTLDITSYIYSYTTQNDEENDLEKFGGSLGSPKSQGSTKSGSLKGPEKFGTSENSSRGQSIKPPTKKIKELVNETYDVYLAKLGRV